MNVITQHAGSVRSTKKTSVVRASAALAGASVDKCSSLASTSPKYFRWIIIDQLQYSTDLQSALSSVFWLSAAHFAGGNGSSWFVVAPRGTEHDWRRYRFIGSSHL